MPLFHGTDSPIFSMVLKSIMSNFDDDMNKMAKNCHDFVQHQDLLISLKVLNMQGLCLTTVVQKCNDINFLMSFAFHQQFNEGPSVGRTNNEFKSLFGLSDQLVSFYYYLRWHCCWQDWNQFCIKVTEKNKANQMQKGWSQWTRYISAKMKKIPSCSVQRNIQKGVEWRWTRRLWHFWIRGTKFQRKWMASLLEE